MKNNFLLKYRRGLFVELLLTVQLLTFPAISVADDTDSGDTSTTVEEESPDVLTGDADSGTYSDSPFFEVLDTPQQIVSRYLESVVRSTDEFFSNEKTSYVSTGSSMRLTLDSILYEGGKIGYAGNLSLKIRLPATQGKLKLLVESDPQETQNVLDRRTEPSPQQAVDQKKYYAGLLGSFGRDVGWQFEPSAGVHLGSPIEVFARFRAVKHLNYPSWGITLNNSLYWYNVTGTGNDSTLEFNYTFDNRLLARSSSFARWSHQTDYFSLSQVFSLIHTLSTRRAVTYSAGVYGISEPTVYATDYVLSAQYRQALRLKNFFFEVNPSLRFRQANDFKNEYSLLLRVEWIFQE